MIGLLFQNINLVFTTLLPTFKVNPAQCHHMQHYSWKIRGRKRVTAKVRKRQFNSGMIYGKKNSFRVICGRNPNNDETQEESEDIVRW